MECPLASRIEAVATWEQCPPLHSEDAAVVFDVLRATSAMTAAARAGVIGILPVATLEEARTWRDKMPDAYIAGERDNRRPPGFDKGNSPDDWGAADAGRQVIWTTTNGTQAFARVRGAGKIIAGALVNAHAVAMQLARHEGPIWLVAAGTHGRFAWEDWLGAGAVASELAAAQWSDATRAAALAFQAAKPHLERHLADAEHAQRLKSQGLDSDVRWCAGHNTVPVVLSRHVDGWLRPGM